MATIYITWHTMGDDRVCSICQQLEGYTWMFETGKDQLGGELVHPGFGVVWSNAVGSEAHGHKGNCRCHITSGVDIQSLLNRAKTLHDMVLEMIPEPER